MQTLELPIILVSKSPRRRQLLEQAGFQFIIKPQDVPEDYPEDMPVEEVAPFLAQKKVRASMHALQGNGVLLGADSVVILDGVIYEKPKDRSDAQRILRELSGRKHTVITGVCLANERQERVFSGISRVHFDRLSDEEIDFYVDKYQPYDKAGAYAIQEWIGLCKINKIEGTYANIMGLPVDLVYQELQHFL
ncbi:Maf family protein [Phaeodactylibacter xiamenensis]|uniref:Maf family protein n=1 Tax=Phaeodactylibacter xiamenensis TaxID=1524460 RepID=UPI0024A857D4|nr:Maf family protein [Phaeodactylibacter xiamenensis]